MSVVPAQPITTRPSAWVAQGCRAETWSRATSRGEVRGRPDHDQRAAVRPTLGQIPGQSAPRTAMYAPDLRDRIAQRR